MVFQGFPGSKKYLRAFQDTGSSNFLQGYRQLPQFTIQVVSVGMYVSPDGCHSHVY